MSGDGCVVFWLLLQQNQLALRDRGPESVISGDWFREYIWPVNHWCVKGNTSNWWRNIKGGSSEGSYKTLLSLAPFFQLSLFLKRSYINLSILYYLQSLKYEWMWLSISGYHNSITLTIVSVNVIILPSNVDTKTFTWNTWKYKIEMFFWRQ